MCLFETSLLTTTHRIAVIDAGSYDAILIRFEIIGLSEFRTTVCENDRQHGLKFIDTAQCFLEGIKCSFDIAGFMAWQQPCIEKQNFRIDEGQDAF